MRNIACPSSSWKSVSSLKNVPVTQLYITVVEGRTCNRCVSPSHRGSPTAAQGTAPCLCNSAERLRCGGSAVGAAGACKATPCVASAANLRTPAEAMLAVGDIAVTPCWVACCGRNLSMSTCFRLMCSEEWREEAAPACTLRSLWLMKPLRFGAGACVLSTEEATEMFASSTYSTEDGFAGGFAALRGPGGVLADSGKALRRAAAAAAAGPTAAANARRLRDHVPVLETSCRVFELSLVRGGVSAAATKLKRRRNGICGDDDEAAVPGVSPGHGDSTSDVELPDCSAKGTAGVLMPSRAAPIWLDGVSSGIAVVVAHPSGGLLR
jgi:hypothetical protein